MLRACVRNALTIKLRPHHTTITVAIPHRPHPPHRQCQNVLMPYMMVSDAANHQSMDAQETSFRTNGKLS